MHSRHDTHDVKPGSLRRWIKQFATGIAASALSITTSLALSPSTVYADDYEQANQWILDQINAEEAWEKSKGEDITIAILDSGIMEHPYFDDKDVKDGEDFLTDSGSAYSPASSHGTQVSAAALNVAPEATILPVVVHSEGDTGLNVGNWRAVAEGIRWAVDQGADILNFSFFISSASDDEEELVRDALQYAMNNDVAVVAGAGNDPENQVYLPAAFEGVITVSGSNSENTLWESSTTGPEVTVAAPGDEQRCPIGHADAESDSDWYNEGNEPEDEWESCRGTSLASPAAAGSLALIMGSDSEIDANNAINRLIHTASNGIDGHDNELGYGIIDANAAINANNLNTVDQNPLGEPGASNNSDDDSDTAPGDESVTDEPAIDNASDSEDSNTLAILLIAAASLIVIAAIITWLILRNRAKPKQM
ncbi:S8 family serine peptidase [Haloglycomyces albus]|uniref:S8 family serine peptidase n=1 Tax=Haloglycomyces albus TaxID=526067 RepID=UPI00046D4E24|nr:S8 family serine peptidase [Haloglycomyces albus]